MKLECVWYVTKRGYDDTNEGIQRCNPNDRAGGVLAKYRDIRDTYEVPMPKEVTVMHMLGMILSQVPSPPIAMRVYIVMHSWRILNVARKLNSAATRRML